MLKNKNAKAALKIKSSAKNTGSVNALKTSPLRLTASVLPATCLNTLTFRRKSVLLVPKTLSITLGDKTVSAALRINPSLTGKHALLALINSTSTYQRKAVKSVKEVRNSITIRKGAFALRQLLSGQKKSA